MRAVNEYFRYKSNLPFIKTFTIYEFEAVWDDEFSNKLLSKCFYDKCQIQKEFPLTNNSVLMIEPYLQHDLPNSLLFWSVEYEKKSEVSVNPSISSKNLDIYEVPDMHDAQLFFSVTKNTIFAAIQIKSTNSLAAQLKLILNKLDINCDIKNVADISSLQKLQDEGFKSINMIANLTQADLPVKKRKMFSNLFKPTKSIDQQVAIGWLRITESENPTLSISDPVQLMDGIDSECFIETKKNSRLKGDFFKNKYTLYLKKYAKNTVTRTSGFKAIEYVTKKYKS